MLKRNSDDEESAIIPEDPSQRRSHSVGARIRLMKRAIELAAQAESLGDVPVGALVTDERGDIIGEGFNCREGQRDPVGHAEIIALRQAAERLGQWRLNNCTLYVTLEPCVMCAGALVNARVDTLVFGALDPKGGAVRTLYAICEDPRLNHRPTVIAGVCARECSEQLSVFFNRLRADRAEGAMTNDRGPDDPET